MLTLSIPTMAMFPLLDTFWMLCGLKSGGTSYHPVKAVCNFNLQILVLSTRSEALLDLIVATCHCSCCCHHPNLIVVSASSSLPLLPHSWWQEDGAAGAKDAAWNATATAKFVICIVTHSMVGHHGPRHFGTERLQWHWCCIDNDNINNDQHWWHSMPPPQNHNITLLLKGHYPAYHNIGVRSWTNYTPTIWTFLISHCHF